jgi:hypothetical protein
MNRSIVSLWIKGLAVLVVGLGCGGLSSLAYSTVTFESVGDIANLPFLAIILSPTVVIPGHPMSDIPSVTPFFSYLGFFIVMAAFILLLLTRNYSYRIFILLGAFVWGNRTALAVHYALTNL